MKLSLSNGSPLYLEIRQSSLRALHGKENLQLGLERAENGRLSAVCRERLVLALQNLLKRKSWQPRVRAICAIAARGVSLRRLSLPASPKEELNRLLNLQIESEFPLPPDALAWGYRRLDAEGALARQDLLVVAVKKEVLEEYSEILSRCGVNPQFTLSALARTSLCDQTSGACALLDIGRKQSELISFENSNPVSIRILNWGGEHITHAIEQSLGVGREEAEKLKIQWDNGRATDGELGKTIHAAILSSLDSLAATIKTNWTGQKLYLTGRSTRYKDMPAQLSQRLGPSIECERLESIPGDGSSAAILGLQKSESPLLLRLKESKGDDAQAGSSSWRSVIHTLFTSKGDDSADRVAPWKWAALAALLAFSSLAFPYVEAFLLKNRLAKQLQVIKRDKARLPVIDRELGFLQHLKNTQPPYIDALSIMSIAAQSGTRIDSLSMNRRGELSLRGSMRGSQQVTEFRSKLIQSGFFSAVSVDEQSPSPDRQKFTVRITAQWKPIPAREHAAIDPTPEELEKMKNRAKEGGQFGPPPGMEMPPGMMPPGAMPPGVPGPKPPSMRPSPSSSMPAEFSRRYGMSMDGKGSIVRSTNPPSSQIKSSEGAIEIRRE